MDEINKRIGRNIKDYRTERGYTQADLATRYEILSEHPLTVAQLSYWENGKSKIYAYQLDYLARALDCSPMSLFSRQITNMDYRLHEEVDCISKDTKEIFYFMLTKWYGNTRALFKFIGLYVSLPPRDRQAIAELGIVFYKACKERKQLTVNAPRVDIAYLEEEVKRLW